MWECGLLSYMLNTSGWTYKIFNEAAENCGRDSHPNQTQCKATSTINYWIDRINIEFCRFFPSYVVLEKRKCNGHDGYTL